MTAAPCRILVVDDEPDVETLVRQKFRRKIRDNEYAFLFARDGEQALRVVEDDPEIDIVMTDINMPVMDGLTLLSRLNAIDRILKIVIVSAYGDIQNIRTAMNRGAYDFLTKPIDFQDFEVTVQKTIHEVEARKEGQRLRRQMDVLQHELGVASRIQQSMLPRTFLLAPGRNQFEAFAEMIPARSVGGDFFDLFEVDENRVGFLIGDVSGKGVPAALFMAVSRTLLRATALQGMHPGECLQYANSILARQSDAAMFVTVFYGILDPRSGKVEYCAGGHNPPFCFSASGCVTPLANIGGMIVGAFEHARYETATLQLEPGDGLLLYTDGVSEAMDAAGNEFSEDRLAAALCGVNGSPAREIVGRVLREVRAFTAGAPQNDDITVFVLKYLRQ